MFPSLAKKLTRVKKFFQKSQRSYQAAIVIDLACILLLVIFGVSPVEKAVTPIIQPTIERMIPLQSLKEEDKNVKTKQEVFGFAPYWTFDKLDGVDFNVLTTLAYFGIPLNGDGTLQKNDPGYETFHSSKATEVFKKAHKSGTRVSLTLTQFSNYEIELLLRNPAYQKSAIDQAVAEVKDRGIDGINVDLEYNGDPGDFYRDRFTKFVEDLTNELHNQVPNSKVTVSVYASSAKDPKIYDIAELSKVSDGIFMMAYDFAVAGADQAMPTAPLYGHKEGKYWYDIATAVDDFLKVMPAEKLILGVPWYGYNYLVNYPGIKANTLPYYSWQGQPTAQTYAKVVDNVHENMGGINYYAYGWDNDGKVGWKAYYNADVGTWRMIFSDDVESLGYKYDFVKDKHLGGVGMWALGFEEGKQELWLQLAQEFGLNNLADSNLINEEGS